MTETFYRTGNCPGPVRFGWDVRKREGVLKDNVRAYIWWNIAASSGDEMAVKNRSIVAKQMTPAQIAEAQKLARECVRKKYKGC